MYFLSTSIIWQLILYFTHSPQINHDGTDQSPKHTTQLYPTWVRCGKGMQSRQLYWLLETWGFSCIVLILVFFSKTGFSCVAQAVLELCRAGWLGIHRDCLSLRSAGIKGVHCPARLMFLNHKLKLTVFKWCFQWILSQFSHFSQHTHLHLGVRRFP